MMIKSTYVFYVDLQIKIKPTRNNKISLSLVIFLLGQRRKIYQFAVFSVTKWAYLRFIYVFNFRFPAKYSTLIFGSELSIAGVFSMIQYALFVWGDSYPNAIDHVSFFK